MRINYYRFPDNVPEDVRLKYGCAVRLKNGGVRYLEKIPEDKRYLVDFVDWNIGGLTLTKVKQLMRKFGGEGYTEHIDRDGSIFEVSEVKIKGNNSRVSYNRHL